MTGYAMTTILKRIILNRPRQPGLPGRRGGSEAAACTASLLIKEAAG
ncbi:hypothetical protein [Actinomadura spongiicola]|nr:hypothetical protein [Actinomadura spongiicola]